MTIYKMSLSSLTIQLYLKINRHVCLELFSAPYEVSESGWGEFDVCFIVMIIVICVIIVIIVAVIIVVVIIVLGEEVMVRARIVVEKVEIVDEFFK